MNNSIGLHSFWLPRQSSTMAAKTDFAWDVVTIVSIFFFVLVVGAMCYFVLRYRRRSEKDVTSTLDHNLQMEVTWTVIPLAIVIGLFVVGFRGYVSAAVAPGDAMEIQVVAEKWRWTFTYPNGSKTINELRAPAGKPVKMVMSSRDVIHSFFIPEFRIKQDVVPGLYTSVWFQADDPVNTVLECTEYCGAGHSDMLANVFVMDANAFNDWLEKGGDDGKDVPPAELGKKLYSKLGCEACHSTDGTIKQAPSFKGLFGRQEKMSDGTTVAVDENYLKESILVPTAKVVQGFQPIMPAFQGLVKDKELEGLIAFIKAQK